MTNQLLGIDIGGSGIKAALVDLDHGVLTTERERVDTPQPATPEAVSATLATVVAGFEYEGTLGIGFPSVIRGGIVETANNIDPGWIGLRVGEVFAQATGHPTVVVNDADAAAVAEERYGAAAGVPGLVLTITFGTGIGSGLLVDGRLVPNLELGQLEFEGHIPAETYFSAKARRREDLSWEDWGERANRFLVHVNQLFSPDLMVIGGGLTKHWENFAGSFDSHLPLAPATMGNSAGIVGAAIMGADRSS